MKKNTLLLLGLGAAAIFLLMRRGQAQARRRGSVIVESPEAITEEEFGTPEEPQRGSIIESVKNIADKGGEVIRTIRTARQQRQAGRQVVLPGGMVVDPRQIRKFAAQKKREQAKKQRQQRRATRKQQRQAKRRKVGEIGILF